MPKQKILLTFEIALIVVFALFMLFRAPNKNSQSLKKAPDFTVKTFQGKRITLSKLDKNKVIVVNFWASWCPSCREEAPDLEKVWRRYKEETIFIGVDIKDTEKDALAYIKEFDITYPNGFGESNVGRLYGITGVPETFIIKDGLIYEHIIGATTEEGLAEKIEKVL